jgi:hypothetical protein
VTGDADAVVEGGVLTSGTRGPAGSTWRGVFR